ncbi:MAG: hypothetical protein PHJ00_02415 [Candidatus Omnitrophica bacterium]|nr:hypothetical protein [Candidatus Omnitrophota bacterium]MDD5655056.1 hypothetical protein [Candidatus Omnitrophota bacterium]
MAKVEFVHYKEKEILLIDFSGTPDDILPTIEAAKEVISKQPPNSLLTLTDVTDSKFNNDVREHLKTFVVHNKPHVKAAAVVGVTGLKKVLYTVVVQFSGRNLPAFDTLDEAKEWLVKQ